MKHFKRFLLFIIIFLSVLFFSDGIYAVSDSANLNLEVTGACNNNGVCEPGLGESILSCPADCSSSPESGEGVSGGLVAFHIQSVFVEGVTPGSATVFWQTTRPAYCNLFFGATTEHENGTISETQFKIDHSVKLTDLQNSTVYYFKIGCKDTMDFFTEAEDYFFSTLSVLNNVSNLKISIGDTQLTLTWDNPLDSDFSKVKVLRSAEFYPVDLNQSEIIYEGDKNFFIDTDLINGTKYYYTVFAYNLAGDHSSSGAIVSGVPTSGFIMPSVSPLPFPYGWEMSFGEFNFFMEGEDVVWFGESTIKVSVHKQMLVSIYDKQLPPLTKTIVFTLEKDDEAFSFLLGRDKSKILYETAIPPTLGAGNYNITISIFNQVNELISEISGELRLGRIESVFQFRWRYELPIYIIILLIVIILILFGLKKEGDIFGIVGHQKKSKNKKI